MKHNKSHRLLYLYEKIFKGGHIKKKETSNHFAVDEKTIQRDIEELRAYIDEINLEGSNNTLIYDHRTHSYRLSKQPDYLLPKKILVRQKEYG